MNEFDITSSWESAWIVCMCGGVFQASGDTATVRAKQKAWEAEHENCPRWNPQAQTNGSGE